MPANIEIKAKINHLPQLEALAARLSDGPGQLLEQEDIFFQTERGRLKLRIFSPQRGELIYYERADAAGPKQSTYFISPTAEPDSLKQVLSQALGIRGVVRKRRRLYLVQNTRIHLDQVAGLGDFLELEVVLGPQDTARQGQAIASELMAKLGVDEADLIEVAYIDLLEGQGGE